MEPTLIGYFPKRVVAALDWLQAGGEKDVCSVRECVSPGPEGWIDRWAHNEMWAFDDEEIAWGVEDRRGVSALAGWVWHPLGRPVIGPHAPPHPLHRTASAFQGGRSDETPPTLEGESRGGAEIAEPEADVTRCHTVRSTNPTNFGPCQPVPFVADVRLSRRTPAEVRRTPCRPAIAPRSPASCPSGRPRANPARTPQDPEGPRGPESAPR